MQAPPFGPGGQELQAKSMASMVRSSAFTLSDRITEAIQENERRLEAAKRARDLLNKNPDMEELINLLGMF